MASPVRIAVVGAGLIGRQHVRRVLDEPEALLVAIVDPSDAARTMADGLGVPWFAEPAAMLEAGLAEGAIIATPNRLHVENGLACVAAGLPMLMEKPIADDLASGRALARAAARAEVPILVGHHRRHSPLIQAARAIVAAGGLGRIATVNALCWFKKPDDYFDATWRRAPGGGPVLINLIHVVDDLLNLCGDVSGLQAVEASELRGFAVEDSAAVLLRFANGALGTISLSDGVAAPWSWEMTAGEDKAYPQTDQFCYLIGGSEASLAVPRLELWRHDGERGWWSPIVATRRHAPEQDPLLLQLRQFCRVVRHGEPPLVPAAAALRTLEVTLAIKQAAAHGAPVALSPAA